MTIWLRLILGIACALATLHALAAIDIAFVTTLSGPRASTGRDQLDGFLLAVSQNRGRLGGLDVRVLTFDDAGRVENVTHIAARIAATHAQFVTGFTDAGIALAIHERIPGDRVLFLSSGAAPIALAGERCSANFFSAAPADDVVHENAGAIAKRRRYSKAYLLVSPDSQGVVEAAFKRQFTGNVEAIKYSGQTPVAAQVQQIRMSAPDVVYLALPKDAAKAVLIAFGAAGLFHRTPIIVAQTDPDLIEVLGAPFSGTIVSVRWASSTESERSRAFVEAYKKRYRRLPSVFAMQGYDAALMLGEAFRVAARTKLTVKTVAHALATQSVEAVEGRIQLGANGFPASDWHAWEIFNNAAGDPYLVAREPTLHEYVDSHSERCAAR
jgi:branched-chain amino acid transport system substrate-binding protein